MLRIFHGTNYDFIRWWKVAVILTVIFVVAGLGSLALRGINYSIDFTGGTLVQVSFNEPVDIADIRTAVTAAGVHNAEVSQFGSNREYTVRAQDQRSIAAQDRGAESVASVIRTALEGRFGAENFKIDRTEAVGPRVGSELRRGAVYAMLISFLVTLIYLAIRFEWRFGVAAVIATGHDFLTTLAFLKLMNLEVSLTVIAAILTVIGYSLNDTIIIFDRVREDLKKSKNISLYDVLNRAINETLPRSVMTHATTFLATAALLVFAGEIIRPFAWVMTFGIFTGTFSSIYVAGPILIWIDRKWPRGHRASTARSEPSGNDAPRSARDSRPAAAATKAAPSR